jgi:hypothetical protein
LALSKLEASSYRGASFPTGKFPVRDLELEGSYAVSFRNVIQPSMLKGIRHPKDPLLTMLDNENFYQ